eukprot:CAMPEP_0115194204 /NCGR_PEP_ID=MMETSP0270-20121206/13951_1 /TAXON_ID=71861 /ORGANISM="Scrippsiella trochoidea, Strain CCMP3099" /LENGTH=652 /DNA_ID=CAMNT_0002607501 /DNA_START=164 /DNA_END=2119 /DNA_ORIENTATION=+
MTAELERTICEIRLATTRYQPSEDCKPWLDGDKVIWDPIRVAVAKVVMSTKFESIMGIIIIFNIGLIWYETDVDAQCYPQYLEDFENCRDSADHKPWVKWTNRILLCIYSLEIFVRIFVERCAYLSQKWNRLDCIIVLSGWTSEVFGSAINMSFLRAFRVARLLRAARVLLSIRELYLLMSGFVSSLRTIAYGAFMLTAMLVLSSILVVQLLHPINSALQYSGCDRCSRGFQSVATTSLTLFQQIVAGDSWGMISVPVIEQNPWIAGPVLLTVAITVGLGLMNLILAVIVERAAEAREHDTLNRAKQKEKDRQETMIELAALCARMDIDGSGTLSLSELLEGFETSDQFQSLMKVMDVSKEDLSLVFSTLQNTKVPERRKGPRRALHVADLADHAAPEAKTFEDPGEQLSYIEFCEQLHRVQSRDMRMMLLEVTSILHEVRRDLAELKREKAMQGNSPRGEKLPVDAHPSDFDRQPTCGSTRTPGPHEEEIPRERPSPSQVSRLGESASAVAVLGGTVALGVAPADGRGSQEALEKDLSSLQVKVEELKDLKVEVLRRLECQVAALSSQAKQLATCRDSLDGLLPKSAADRSEGLHLNGTVALGTSSSRESADATVDELRGQVARLRADVELRLRESLQVFQQTIEAEDPLV